MTPVCASLQPVQPQQYSVPQTNFGTNIFGDLDPAYPTCGKGADVPLTNTAGTSDLDPLAGFSIEGNGSPPVPLTNTAAASAPTAPTQPVSPSSETNSNRRSMVAEAALELLLGAVLAFQRGSGSGNGVGALVNALGSNFGGGGSAAAMPVQPTSPEMASKYKDLINDDMQTAYGRPATQDDYNYWLPKLEGPCDSCLVTGGQMSGTEYWHRRMLGWEAGGSSAPTSGPYANGGNGPVPPLVAGLS